MCEYEIYKDILGYEGLYQISNLGNVKSLRKEVYRVRNKSNAILKEKILKQSISERGYKFFILYKNGKREQKYTHVCVAETFIGKTNGMTVNHKNLNKTDNFVSNLEIVTQKENIQHYWRNNKVNEILCTETGIFYESINDAAESRCFKKPTLSNMLYGKRKNRTSIVFC